VAAHLDDLAVHRVMRAAIALLALGAWRCACAHGVAPGGGATDDFAERLVERALYALLVAGAILYAAGVAALWGRAGARRGLRAIDGGAFVAGWAVLAISLSGPVDALTDASFAVHMIQHEAMMVVAAPLIVLGRPLEAWAWAMRAGFGTAGLRWSRARWLRAASATLGGSWVAWSVHAVALWGWHVPAFFRAALERPGLHLAQHACFFGTALLYWSSVLGRRDRTPSGASLASLFTTMLHTSALGALLTFAPVAWYAAGTDRVLGLSALEDQQLGGLVMWVPGGIAYLIAGLALVGRWLAQPRVAVWRPLRPRHEPDIAGHGADARRAQRSA
jgi:cytochrome c oxidase assembly factor CtaG